MPASMGHRWNVMERELEDDEDLDLSPEEKELLKQQSKDLTGLKREDSYE